MRKFLSALILFGITSLAGADVAPLFSVTLHDLDNQPARLANYKGKPLIVNFWARWCAPCREEIPEFIRLQEEQRGKLEILGIALEDDAAAVREFARQYHINYPLFLAREKGMALMQAVDNQRGGLPFTVVINRQGKVVYSQMGRMRRSDLDKAAALARQ